MEGHESVGSGASPAPAPVVETRAVRKVFGELVAVDGIDLALPAGRVYGLIGPNGSGKTTLIRMLVGLARPTAGEVLVLGERMPSRPLLSRIGYMTQADGIYPELSVAENLRFFGDLYGGVGRAALDRILGLVELSDRAGSPAIELSGGMRRRLSLACALVHAPSVLFLDEPTVGVDPALRVAFWEHFRSLAASGVTLLVTSHVMDEADRCDELLFIRAGRVIARGTADELRREGGSERLEDAFLRLAVAGGAGAAGREVR